MVRAEIMPEFLLLNGPARWRPPLESYPSKRPIGVIRIPATHNGHRPAGRLLWIQ